MDDQCPVCKSDRYLNPKLRLLVSSCYHKMCVYRSYHYLSRCFNVAFFRCESCIDRLFTLGPAPCPICNKVLRKLAFTPQTFEDLAVEKEVAVRRRITKEWVFGSPRIPHILTFWSRFNKRREDFTDLRAYNNYLEEVEDISVILLFFIRYTILTCP
jgi:CDK-activating kinase assembly factor MAT1